MQDRIKEVLTQRKKQGKTWNYLAEGLAIKGNALRMAFDRGSMDIFYLEHVENKLGITQNTQYKEHNTIHKINDSGLDYVHESQEIPYYDIEATASVVTLFKDPKSSKPIDTIKIPNMPKCDGAITVTGDSMYPLIKSGDIVFYKTIMDLPNSILYGNMYIVSLNIEGDELVMIKYVQKGKDDNHVILVSENKHHADKEIHIKYINGLALVKGNVRFNFTT